MSEVFTDQIFLTKLKEYIKTIPFKNDREKLESAIFEIERLNNLLSELINKE